MSTENDKLIGIGIVVGAILLPLMLVYACLTSGLVVYCLWHWFVVALGAPSITFMHSMGLGTVIGCFKTSQAYIPKEREYNWSLWIAPWITLAFGFVIKSFM